jgi:hypothetical protein
LHEYLYLNNKLRTFSLFCFFISHFTNTYGFSFERTDNIFANCIFVRIREIFKTNRETWRSARKPGDSRVNRETWQLCIYRSVMLDLNFWRGACVLFADFLYHFMYISSLVYSVSKNGSYFRNKAQYLVSIFIFCSDLFTLQLIVIDLILITHHRVTQLI